MKHIGLWYWGGMVIWLSLCYCTYNIVEPMLRYEDTQGTWILDSLTFIADSGGIERVPCSKLTIDGDSMYTPTWVGYVYMIGDACKRSAARNKEVINIEWREVGDTLKTTRKMHLSLEDMKGGDILVIGNCVSVNCYVNQFAEPEECYSRIDTLAKQQLPRTLNP